MRLFRAVDPLHDTALLLMPFFALYSLRSALLCDARRSMGCTLLPGYLVCLSCSRRRSRCSTGMPSCVAAAHMEMSTYVRPQCLSMYERSKRAACRVVLSSGTTISCRQLKPSPRSQSAMASLMWLWRSSDRPPSGHVRACWPLSFSQRLPHCFPVLFE